jgi:hypothetical protein
LLETLLALVGCYKLQEQQPAFLTLETCLLQTLSDSLSMFCCVSCRYVDLLGMVWQQASKQLQEQQSVPNLEIQIATDPI